MSAHADDGPREAVAAELSALTANSGPAGTYSPRATDQLFANDPSRALLRKEIVNRYLGDGPPRPDGERRAVITAGVPGAGKSTAVDAILGSDASQFRRLDADVVKDELLADALDSGLYADLLEKQLADGKTVAPRELAALVHVESTQILDTLRRHAIARGEQMVIEGTLAWSGLGEVLLTELQEAGYANIRVVVVEVPEPIAQHRATDRWWKVRSAGIDALGCRFTPPSVIAGYYRPGGVSVCKVNAESLIRDASARGLTVVLDVVDETGRVKR